MRPTPMKRRLRPPERGWDRPLLKIELPGLTFIDYSFCVNFSCLVRAGGKKKTRAKMQKPKRGGKTSRHALQITADCTAHRARRHTQHAYHATHAEITVRLHHARAKRGQPHRDPKKRAPTHASTLCGPRAPLLLARFPAGYIAGGWSSTRVDPLHIHTTVRPPGAAARQSPRPSGPERTARRAEARRPKWLMLGASFAM